MDALAALFISFSVLKDGFKNVRNSVRDLMDRRPIHVDDQQTDGLVDAVEKLVRSWDWVQDAEVRFRENGQVYFGEIYVIVKQDKNLSKQLAEAVRQLNAYHWKLQDIIIMTVLALPILE